jgi:hypothetical protein
MASDIDDLRATVAGAVPALPALPPDVIDRPPQPRRWSRRVSFRPLPEGDAATLDALMADDVAHLRHHLRQILGEGWR